jgi:hypothetical protein
VVYGKKVPTFNRGWKRRMLVGDVAYWCEVYATGKRVRVPYHKSTFELRGRVWREGEPNTEKGCGPVPSTVSPVVLLFMAGVISEGVRFRCRVPRGNSPKGSFDR